MNRCTVDRSVRHNAVFKENFRAHVERLGYFPASILHVKPQTAIEAVAMRLTTQTIQETIAADGS